MDYPSFWDAVAIANYEASKKMWKEQGIPEPAPWWSSNPEWAEAPLVMVSEEQIKAEKPIVYSQEYQERETAIQEAAQAGFTLARYGVFLSYAQLVEAGATAEDTLEINAFQEGQAKGREYLGG